MALFDDSKKKFELHENEFTYSGKPYKYDDILHISYEGVVIDYKVNFVFADELKNAYLEIDFKSENKIRHKIQEAQYLVGFSQDKSALIEELKQVFFRLLRESFESRLAGYERQIDQFGYYIWDWDSADDKAKLSPRTRSIIRERDGAVFSMSNSEFSRTSSEFRMETKEACPDLSIGNKIARKLLRIGMGLGGSLSTKRDPDVFYYLMDRYFGIRW
jgi:hypothetical protein